MIKASGDDAVDEISVGSFAGDWKKEVLPHAQKLFYDEQLSFSKSLLKSRAVRVPDLNAAVLKCATRDIEQCKGKIHEHGGTLLHEHAQSYILLSCLEDEMNGYHDKMVLSARNSQILSHVTELATSLQRHPRDVVLPFFKRIAEEQYRKGFEEAVAGFASRIENRAVEKRKEMGSSPERARMRTGRRMHKGARNIRDPAHRAS